MGGFPLRSPTRSSPTGSDGTSRAATCPPEPPWNVPGPGVLARGTHHQAMRSDERIAGYWWLSSVRFVLEEREELIDAAENERRDDPHVGRGQQSQAALSILDIEKECRPNAARGR
ncbi:MAG: hypothetical protein QOG44_3515 [Acidimicrobiaceae bacterium]|nr:hypothetical protein [Acidimicrobiaceae bacterium]